MLFLPLFKHKQKMADLQKKLEWANKRCKFAWAKYYETRNNQLRDDSGYYTVFNRVSDDRSIPEHIKDEMKMMATALKKKWECPFCLEMIDNDNLEITNCGHFYCKPCLTKWKEQTKEGGEAKWKCGICNRSHNIRDE